jgi:hypothetical protein
MIMLAVLGPASIVDNSFAGHESVNRSLFQPFAADVAEQSLA